MTPVLETIGVRKKFSGVTALHDFRIAVDVGELHGLVGTNGSGKTTILNVIGGQLMADGGIVRLAGRDIERLSSWRRAGLGLGRTFQEGRLWSDLTVEEHFQIAIDASVRAGNHVSKDHALEVMCSIADFSVVALKRTPEQMNLLDRRRVELAMALLNASHLLLVDEIAAGLGIDEARTLYRVISQAIKGSHARAAVVVEHNLELLAEFATGISLIEDGIVSQRADCNEASQLAHLMDRMFDRRGEVGGRNSLERGGLAMKVGSLSQVILAALIFCWSGSWTLSQALAQAAAPVTVEWTLEKTNKALEREATLAVANGQGQPVSGATIEVNVDMPSMPMMHKVPKVIAEPAGEPGRYKARFTVEMAGAWAAQIEVKGPVRAKVIKKFHVD